MTELVRYEAACRAVAEAKSVDEVKDIMDKAAAMRLYAHQAKNKTLEVDAQEIRFRAERRLGEMLREQKETVGLAPAGRPKKIGPDEGPIIKTPTLADAGIDKNLSSRAQKIAAVPAEKFEGMIGEWRERVSQENERVTSSLLKEGTKAQQRAQREAELAERQAELPEKKYGVIYADPEWRFEPFSRDSGMDRAADNHYPTSETDKIAARDVASIAADDCILFLWATAPMLEHALRVMNAWGFAYKSQAVWVKDRIGTGYWFRNQHEILLIGTRGSIPAPAPGTQWSSVIEAKVREHSRKPDQAYKLIEAYFPTLSKIELNCRGPARAGWDAWGNEAGTHEDAA